MIPDSDLLRAKTRRDVFCQHRVKNPIQDFDTFEGMISQSLG